MKRTLVYGAISLLFWGCGSRSDRNIAPAAEVQLHPKEHTTDETSYEIVVLDVQFDRFLQTRAQPRGYYSQAYLEQRNRQAVPDFNRLVRSRPLWNAQEIELELGVDYGYEVHYILYNYFQYFSDTHRVRIGSFVPRR